MGTLPAGQYVNDKQTGAVHIAYEGRQDITYCGITPDTNGWTVGEETIDGIAATCVRCRTTFYAQLANVASALETLDRSPGRRVAPRGPSNTMSTPPL